nr:mutant S-locus cysteine-rich protein haplogroup A [Arabidopsis kamchatica]WNT94716.1 mutant S-locus cysteine-rich protein haplogroup A [Arabidopsis kamchatica]
MRSAASFIIACVFIPLVLSHGQDVEARVMDKCNVGIKLKGKCGINGKKACVEAFVKYKSQTPLQSSV